MSDTSEDTRGKSKRGTTIPKDLDVEGLTRLNVNLNAETAGALKAMATEKGISYTEAVRRAIAISKFIDDEIRDGRKVQTLSRNDDQIRELVLF